jgi:hypothetical protein
VITTNMASTSSTPGSVSTGMGVRMDANINAGGANVSLITGILGMGCGPLFWLPMRCEDRITTRDRGCQLEVSCRPLKACLLTKER